MVWKKSQTYSSDRSTSRNSMSSNFCHVLRYARINLNLYIAAGQKKMAPHNFLFPQPYFEHKGMNTAAVNGGWNELLRSCVQICVQDKRKSSYDLFRNCLISKMWSHLGNPTQNISCKSNIYLAHFWHLQHSHPRRIASLFVALLRRNRIARKFSHLSTANITDSGVILVPSHS